MSGNINKKGKEIKGRNGAVWLFLAFILGGAVLGALCAISIFKFGQGGSFKKTAAVISETFKDIFSSSKEERAAFEIDMGKPGVASTSGDNAASKGDLGMGQKENFSGNRETAAASQELKGVSGNQGKTASQQPNPPNNSSSAAISPKTSGSGLANSPAVTQAPKCVFSASQGPSRKILFNELAWMGTQISANDEWLELKNPGSQKINLAGWRVLSEDENIEIIFEEGEMIGANGFYLLERTDDNSVPDIKADAIYKGALSNSGAWLKLFDKECNLIDEVNASTGWPAGDNETKKTMERNETDFNWHTASIVGGTPRAKNSTPAQTVSSSTIPVSSSQSSSSQSQPGNATTTLKYTLTVLKIGSSTGVVESDPAGIMCGADCGEEFLPGTSVILNATASSGSSFAGWAGPCTWTGTCTVILSTNTLVTAQFDFMSTSSAAVPSGGGSSNSGGNVIVSEIMAGVEGNSNYEFIELYNPTSQAVNLTGWYIKKRSSTGSESSLIVASRFEGKSIGAGKYLLLANDTGYTGSVRADVLWPHSYTLAYTNNAVILYDASNTKIDEVSWAEIPVGQSYERQPLDGNTFVAQSSPNPQNSSR